MDHHSLLQGAGDLLLVGRHAVPLLQADHGHIGRAQALGRDGHVHCHVSAAHNHHVGAGLLQNIIVHVHQEFQAKPGQFLARQTDQGAFPGAGVQHHAVAVLIDFFQLDVGSHRTAAAEGDAHMFQRPHEPAHDLFGQAIGRNSVGQAAARFLLFLVHGHTVAALAQVTGCSQPCGAGTHDGDVFSILPLRFFEELIRVLQNIVPKETLDAAHVQALVVGVAVAALHAEVGADAAGDGGHGIDLQKHPGRFLIFSRPNHFHISGNVCGRSFWRS